MKTFLIATVLLALITATVAAGGWWLNKALSDTVDALLSLPEELSVVSPNPDPLREVLAAWDKAAKVAVATVPANRLESISRAAKELESAFLANDNALYRKARADLLLLLLETRKAEQFSLASVF